MDDGMYCSVLQVLIAAGSFCSFYEFGDYIATLSLCKTLIKLAAEV